MIGTLFVVAALLQGAAPQVAVTELAVPQAPAAPAAQTPPAGTQGGTQLLKVGDYDLDQFKSELKRGVTLIENGSESAGLAVLDKLANQSVQVRRVRTLVDIERPEHGQLFVERAKAYLSNGGDVEESLKELWKVNPFFRDPLPPRLQQALDQILSKDAGTIEITSSVSGANLLVDGALAGRAGDLPVRVKLLAGSEVEVRATMAGYPKDGVRRVTPVAGSVLGISLSPREITKPVVLLSDRDDIDITMGTSHYKFSKLAALATKLPTDAYQALNGRLAANGLDPNTAAGFVVPDDSIEVGKNVNLAFEGKCLVKLEQTISITENLIKTNESSPLLWLGNDQNVVRPLQDVGTLRINSTPPGAQVFVSVPGVSGVDQAVGTTPVDVQRCSGQYNVRVRHPKVGSFTTPQTVMQGQTVRVDALLKPSVALLGAVDATQNPPRVDTGLAAQIIQTATATLTTFRASVVPIQLSNEVTKWLPQSAVDLVRAVDGNNAAETTRLMNVATANFEAPLMVVAVRRASGNEVLFLWNDHPGADRVPWTGQAADLAKLFTGVDGTSDNADLVYQNDIGIRFADTALPGAPILIVRVDDNNKQFTVGEHIEAVEGAVMNAQGLADRIRRAKPGEKFSIRVNSLAPNAQRTETVTVGRRPRRADVFDSSVQGNVLIAKLSAAALAAAPGPDRDLYNFSLAAAYMRFGEFRAASDLLATVGNPPSGAGVGRGPTAFLKARALEALGQKDAALSALKDAAAATVKDQALADDGAPVGAIADRHLAVFSKTP